MNRSKRDIKQIVFGRTIIILFILLIQLVFLYASTVYLSSQAPFIYILERIVSIVAIIYLNNKDIIPEIKQVWILLIITLPLFGTIFYLYTQLEFQSRKLKTQLDKTHHYYTSKLVQDKDVYIDLYKSSTAIANLSNYMMNNTGYPIYKDTRAKYFSSGIEFYNDLISKIMSAKHYIFMEYFIIEHGYMWDTIAQILVNKSKNGVKVYLMCDGMNVLTKIPVEDLNNLKKYGIEFKLFSPAKPIITTVQDKRDHRKICVVDGIYAYTGGINLADEYINKTHPFGYWKDSAICIEGEGVKSFIAMFLEMWNIGEKTLTNYKQFIPSNLNLNTSGNGFILPFADSPTDNEHVSMNLYCNMFENAKRYIYIMTPYLIPNDIILNSLKSAAKRGVDVRIIMPGIPDKSYAFSVAKTYYNELIRAGVKIFEFKEGFLHSKNVVCDDEFACVGTVNLDYRSFFHHFECGIFLFRNMEILSIHNDFERMFTRSKNITITDNNSRGFLVKLFGYIIKLIAPLM